jgi:hypothetical protein
MCLTVTARALRAASAIKARVQGTVRRRKGGLDMAYLPQYGR